MDGKTIGAFIVGAVVGGVVGFLVASSTGPEGDRGEWPDIPCPEGATTTAGDILDQITNEAMQVVPPTPQSQNVAVTAQQKKMANPADPLRACMSLTEALNKARAKDWDGCKGHLDEID